VAYWLSGRGEAKTVRANIILLFGTTTIFTIVSYLVSGLLSLKVVGISILVGPLYALGLLAGARLFKHADEKIFRKLCFLLIAISVVASLPVWQ
jgi:uncharacterized protein